MVRPERRVVLAGGSPVRVSAGAPGSRLQPGGEIRPSRAECQKPCNMGGEQTGGPQQSVNATASTDYQPKGVWEGRAAHFTAKATDSIPSRNECWTSPGSQAAARRRQNKAEQERPYLAAWSGKDRAYKAGRLKSRGAGRESEGLVLPMKACSKTRWREGALLWSSRRGGKREGMPETANTPFVKARQLRGPAMDVCQVRASAVDPGEGLYRRRDDPSKGLILSVRWRHARHVKKIIVKPCAGKPQARFERGLMETGQR